MSAAAARAAGPGPGAEPRGEPPPEACGYERYDARTLAPANPSTYTRLIELGWDEAGFAGRSVLDVGGGAGSLAVRACQLGAASVRSVDVQAPLVDFLAGVADLHGLPIRAERLGFAELEASEHEADVVLCMAVLHWVVSQRGTSLDAAVAKLASLARETLYLEMPWDVTEPSLASRGELDAADYGAELVLRALGRHFERVEIVRFMTYFGRMPGSRRVLVRADGRRVDGAVLAAVPDARPLGLSMSRGSNPSSMLASPDGMLVLKSLPRESVLPHLEPGALARFAEHLASAEEGTVVAPLPIGGAYVATGADGRARMLFPFVGDLGSYHPVVLPHPPIRAPLEVAARAGRVLASLPADVVAEFRRHSGRVLPVGTDELGAPFAAELERRGLIEPLADSFARMIDYDAALEDAVVHHDMQVGNMLTDAAGRDRLLDLDLVRSGPAYADVLACVAYTGTGAAELDAALEAMRAAGVRALRAFDVDFSLATILGWAREISSQGIVLPDGQAEAVIEGLATLVGKLVEVLESDVPGMPGAPDAVGAPAEPRCFAFAPDATGEAYARAAIGEAERLNQANAPAERVRDLCLLALGAGPREAAIGARAFALLDVLGYTGLAERLRDGAVMLGDVESLAPDAEGAARLFEPATGYASETLASATGTMTLAADNDALGDIGVVPSQWVQQFHGIVEHPRRWELARLEDACVFHHAGLCVVLDSGGRPVESMSHADYRRLYLNREFLRFVADRTAAPRYARALYVQDHAVGSNFAHWLLDTVPRLRLLEEDEHVILYQARAGSVRATFEALGVADERVVELTRTPAMRVGRLTLESSVGRDLHHPTQKGAAPLVEFVRGAFADGADTVTHPRIYVSRNRCPQRRIANEEELLPALEAHGFVTVYAEEHDQRGQAALFRDARIIVSPHGAALSNLMFATRDCSVLELFEPNYGTASFYILAKHLGLSYFSMRGEGEALPEREQRERMAELRKLDITIDAAAFGRALDAIVARSG